MSREERKDAVSILGVADCLIVTSDNRGRGPRGRLGFVSSVRRVAWGGSGRTVSIWLGFRFGNVKTEGESTEDKGSFVCPRLSSDDLEDSGSGFRAKGLSLGRSTTSGILFCSSLSNRMSLSVFRCR